MFENIPLDFLNEAQETISNANEATSNFTKKIIWSVFSKNKVKAFELLKKFGYAEENKYLKELEKRILQHLRLHEISNEINFEYDNSSLLNELNQQLEAQDFHSRLSSVIESHLDLSDKKSFETKMHKWQKLLLSIENSKKGWENLLSKKQIQEFLYSNHIKITNY